MNFSDATTRLFPKAVIVSRRYFSPKKNQRKKINDSSQEVGNKKTRREKVLKAKVRALGVDERRQFVINWSGMSSYGSFKSIFRVVSHCTLECHPD
ncbi:hypothetical protein TNCV_3338661 [Trichonephila clavipes]|nr:hypothetical protein TNCV_3338661 [Trichonephila clavipes]